MTDDNNTPIDFEGYYDTEDQIAYATMAYEDFVSQALSIHGTPTAALEWFEANNGDTGREMVLATRMHAKETVERGETVFDAETLALRAVGYLLDLPVPHTYH